MRPRVFPAEDRQERQRRVRHRRASMRPRVFPAEDFFSQAPLLRGVIASMRPRVFPAEDLARLGPAERRTAGFNEAAGIPRGRPSTPRTAATGIYALQ